MAIGNQASVAGINSQLTSYAVQLRNLCDQIKIFNEFIGTLGAAGLETLGFASADATAVVNTAAIMNTVSALYYGTATQATDYDFDNALSGLWAGQ